MGCSTTTSGGKDKEEVVSITSMPIVYRTLPIVPIPHYSCPFNFKLQAQPSVSCIPPDALMRWPCLSLLVRWLAPLTGGRRRQSRMRLCNMPTNIDPIAVKSSLFSLYSTESKKTVSAHRRELRWCGYSPLYYLLVARH